MFMVHVCRYILIYMFSSIYRFFFKNIVCFLAEQTPEWVVNKTNFIFFLFCKNNFVTLKHFLPVHLNYSFNSSYSLLWSVLGNY